MNNLRARKLMRDIIQKEKLCLEGLTVFTEAATGPYKYNAIIAALSGADKVYALANDSKFASKNEVQRITMEEASAAQVQNVVEVILDSGALQCISHSFNTYMSCKTKVDGLS